MIADKLSEMQYDGTYNKSIFFHFTILNCQKITPMTTLTASRGRLTFVAAALLCSLFVSSNPARADADDGKLRVMVFGAHPADCELKDGAVAAMWAKLGHKVKFVSTVNPAQPNSKNYSRSSWRIRQ